MDDTSLRLAAWVQAAWVTGAHRARTARLDQRGEGVISAAIAVLVMAGIGALMWVGFRTLWQDTEANTRDKVAEIGQ
jgi:biotin transporter BioY